MTEVSTTAMSRAAPAGPPRNAGGWGGSESRWGQRHAPATQFKFDAKVSARPAAAQQSERRTRGPSVFPPQTQGRVPQRERPPAAQGQGATYRQRVRDGPDPVLAQAAQGPGRLAGRGAQEPGQEEEELPHAAAVRHEAPGAWAGGQQRPGELEDDAGAREAQLRGDGGTGDSPLTQDTQGT